MAKVIFAKPDVIILSHPRSGTHFLAASLASHPLVRSRGECLLQLKKARGNSILMQKLVDSDLLNNKHGLINIAIIMYYQVADYESRCGPLEQSKIIHLLRGAESVAQSVLQATANLNLRGPKYRAHYRLGEFVPKNAPRQLGNLEALTQFVAHTHDLFIRRLKSCPDKLTIRYEAVTNNKQVNLIPEMHAKKLLKFLGLKYHPLRNSLRKTG